MKKIPLLAVSVAVMLVMAVPLSAQYSSPGLLKADIPFEFVSGNQTLPAGGYTIKISGSAIGFLGEGGLVQAATLSNPRLANYKEERPRLVFRQYGNQYFLGRIWTPSYNVELPKSHAEHHLQFSLKTKGDNVVIAMR